VGSRQKKRLKNKLGKKVLSGKMTVTEARARLGRDLARKQGFAPVLKAARAEGEMTGILEGVCEAMRETAAAVRADRPVTWEDVLEAARTPAPRPAPAVTKAAAAPVPREDPREQLMLLKSWQADLAARASARPAHHWTSVQAALRDVYYTHPDPETRENARASLAAEGIVI
jgi:hypothetical protein